MVETLPFSFLSRVSEDRRRIPTVEPRTFTGSLWSSRGHRRHTPSTIQGHHLHHPGPIDSRTGNPFPFTQTLVLTTTGPSSDRLFYLPLRLRTLEPRPHRTRTQRNYTPFPRSPNLSVPRTSPKTSPLQSRPLYICQRSEENLGEMVRFVAFKEKEV